MDNLPPPPPPNTPPPTEDIYAAMAAQKEAQGQGTPSAGAGTPPPPSGSQYQPNPGAEPPPPPANDDYKNNLPPSNVTKIPPPDAAPVFDQAAWLAQNFGDTFKSVDDIKAAIAKPPVEKVVEKVIKETEPFKFPNPETQGLYEAMANGEYDKVYPFVQTKVFEKQLATLTPEQVIQAKIAKDYPSLSPQQVQRMYERSYTVNEANLSSEDLDLEKAVMGDKIKRDAEQAKTYFTQLSSAIQFPKVSPPQEPVISDAAKQVMQYGAQFADEKFSNFNFEFTPENTQMSVKQGQISLPDDKVKSVKDLMASDPVSFLSGFVLKRWYKADGTPDIDAASRDIVALDPNNWVPGVVQRSANQMYIEKIKVDKNFKDGSSGGSPVSPEPSEQAQWEKFFHIPPPPNGVPATV